MTPALRAYECQIRGCDWTRTFHATSPGKAKAAYWREAREPFPDLPFTAIRIVSVGPPATSDDFRRTAEYRGVPFARIGMRVEVGGDAGVITGNNASANFNVLFHEGKHTGIELNCHPNWMIKYFDPNGTVLAEFAA